VGAAVVVVEGGAELVVTAEEDGTVETTEDVLGAVEVGSGRAVVVAGSIDVTGAMDVDGAGALVVGTEPGTGGAGSGARSRGAVARQPM
jgi:hypothetical protein